MPWNLSEVITNDLLLSTGLESDSIFTSSTLGLMFEVFRTFEILLLAVKRMKNSITSLTQTVMDYTFSPDSTLKLSNFYFNSSALNLLIMLSKGNHSRFFLLILKPDEQVHCVHLLSFPLLQMTVVILSSLHFTLYFLQVCNKSVLPEIPALTILYSLYQYYLPTFHGAKANILCLLLLLFTASPNI